MPQQMSRVKVGAFVLLGLLLLAGSIVWLGAVRYFQAGRTYVTYFSESVQGLQRDSQVKYRGVDVGRVVDIRVAPDYKLIEVVLHVQVHGDPSESMVAQLKTVGITGIVFVELDLRQPNEPDRSPKINFAAEHPIIPSRPSDISQIMNVVDKVAGELKQIDFLALARKVEAVLDAAQSLAESQRLHNALVSLERSSGHLEKLLAAAERKVAALDTGGISRGAKEVMGRARQVLGEVDRLAASARGLVEDTRSQVLAMELPRTAGKVEALVEEVGEQSGELMEELNQTARSLQRLGRDLESLVRRLERSPSDLIFGAEPPPRRPAQ
jgi:phospholipid/cholesterol/gamma-HCH transport system substrate-binding protein